MVASTILGNKLKKKLCPTFIFLTQEGGPKKSDDDDDDMIRTFNHELYRDKEYFAAFLNKHKVSEKTRAVCTKETIDDAETFLSLTKEDLVEAGMLPIPAGSLPPLLEKQIQEDISGVGKGGGGDHRRGNFGVGGGYSEHGDAIGKIEGGVNNIGGGK